MGIADITGSHTDQNTLLSVAAAATTEAHPFFVAPFPCVVTGVGITPQAAVTGDNTDTKNLNVDNKGPTGALSTEIGNLDLVLATDLVAFDEQAITITETELAKGDVLALEYEQVGTGVLIPNLIVTTTFRPSATVGH